MSAAPRSRFAFPVNFGGTFSAVLPRCKRDSALCCLELRVSRRDLRSAVRLFVNFGQNGVQIITIRPVRIMGLELADIADEPDMIAVPAVLDAFKFQLLPRNPLANLDRFEHRAIAVAAAAGVVDFARAAGSGGIARTC